MGRLGKEYMNIGSYYLSQSERYASRSTAHSARNIHEQWMIAVNLYSRITKLRREPLRRYRVSHEQILGILIVDKVTEKIFSGELASLDNSLLIIIRVLYNRNTLAPEKLLLPPAR